MDGFGKIIKKKDGMKHIKNMLIFIKKMEEHYSQVQKIKKKNL